VFGNIAQPLYTGPFYSTPIYKEWYYEVVLVDIEVNGESLNMDCKEVSQLLQKIDITSLAYMLR